MSGSKYTKIIINSTNRDLFGFLQQKILFDDVEMLFLPELNEVEAFVRRIRPDIVVLSLTQDILNQETFQNFLNSNLTDDIWMIFLMDRSINVSQFVQIKKITKALVISQPASTEMIALNIQTILNQEKSEAQNEQNLQLSENLLNCSKLIHQDISLFDVFNDLINALPKIIKTDYLALFTFDPEFQNIDNFVQFIPPHRRNVAILTPNLEKLAEIWTKQSHSFSVNIQSDPQLFRKLGEWGWGIKQLFFSPLICNKITVGGFIMGAINQTRLTASQKDFTEELSSILADKIYQVIRKNKNTQNLEEFTEQLIFNRFSETSIIQLACKKINEITRSSSVLFWQINRGFGFMFPKFAYIQENQDASPNLEKNMVFWEKDPKLLEILSQERQILVNDVKKGAGFSKASLSTFKSLNYNNLLIAPLKVNREEIGMFIANRPENEAYFGAWELENISVLISRVQKVLEDTFIVKEANHKLKQLSRIFELGNDLKLDLNIETILSRITKSIRQTLGWNDISILRSNDFRQLYIPVNHAGFDNKTKFPINVVRPVNYLDFEKFILNCNKIRNSYFFDSHPIEAGNASGEISDEITGEWHDEDLLLVPIETKSRMMGFLIVHDPVNRLKPNVDRVISLEYFANQAAVALENSMLYENLLASEEKYRSLAETMTLGLVTCTPTGKIIYSNPAFEKMVGISKKKLGNKPLQALFKKESRVKLKESINTVLNANGDETKKMENIELELMNKTEDPIPVSTYVFPLFQQRQKTGVFLVINDLRVLKKLERLKADFNSMIVHDLRSPMNVIQGFIELIRTRVVGEVNSEQEELLDIAKENVKKVLSLVDNFLVASKIEVGKFDIEPKVGEIHSLIQRIVENHQVVLENRQIKLTAKLNENLPLLYFDSLRIEQVLNNLLSNAIKFTEEGRKIEVTTEFHQVKLKGEKKMFAKIGVHDEGTGIPEDHLKTIFEKYEQAESQLAIKSAGTGLGLAICQEIVGLHGGDIWVDSEVNKGSHFYFTLPIEPSIEKFLK